MPRRRGGLGRDLNDKPAVGTGDLHGGGTEVQNVVAAVESGAHPLDADGGAGIENEVGSAGGAEEAVAQRGCQERPRPRSACRAAIAAPCPTGKVICASALSAEAAPTRDPPSRWTTRSARSAPRAWCGQRGSWCCPRRW